MFISHGGSRRSFAYFIKTLIVNKRSIFYISSDRFPQKLRDVKIHKKYTANINDDEHIASVYLYGCN